MGSVTPATAKGHLAFRFQNHSPGHAPIVSLTLRPRSFPERFPARRALSEETELEGRSSRANRFIECSSVLKWLGEHLPEKGGLG